MPQKKDSGTDAGRGVDEEEIPQHSQSLLLEQDDVVHGDAEEDQVGQNRHEGGFDRQADIALDEVDPLQEHRWVRRGACQIFRHWDHRSVSHWLEARPIGFQCCGGMDITKSKQHLFRVLGNSFHGPSRPMPS